MMDPVSFGISKRNKRWATLHAPRGSAFVDFAWHPSEGFQILTALADDSRPVVRGVRAQI